jgi:hypothetical protein
MTVSGFETCETISGNMSWPDEATNRMNRMYRRQRHIYDGTADIIFWAATSSLTDSSHPPMQRYWKSAVAPAGT